jgi:signal transduction histidine kinase
MLKFFKKGSLEISRYYPLVFTIVFVFILFQNNFSTQEAIFYDLRVRFDIGYSFRDNIVLVLLDEESDEFLGETYPYTFTSHNKFLDKIVEDGPTVINYFVNLLEAESEEEKKQELLLKNTLFNYVNKGGYFRFGTDMDAWGEQRPPNKLKDLGYSLSLINVDNAAFSKDNISRRAILNISGEDSLHLWTANKYRESLGLEKQAANKLLGSYYVKEADATFALFRYFTSPINDGLKIKTIPFHRVRVGNFPKGYFKDKIVLVGPSYISNANDFVLTPFDKENYKSSKLAMHAEIIQSLITGKTVYQIPRFVSDILSIFIAIFLSVMISRLKPTHGLLMTIVVMFIIIFLSFILFSLFGVWFYVTHLILTVFVVYYIWVPFRAIGEYQRRYAIQEESKLLKKVESLKQNFISLMSHDLKTPVAKIAGLADVMIQQSHYSGNDGKKNLDAIIDSTKELNKFITSILDLTKIESQNLTLNMISKDVNKVVEQVTSGLKYEASQKNIELKTELSPLYPIQFDLNLMKRVVSNLVENSLKYSGENKCVTVKSWDDEKWVYIEIADNGVGIPPEDLEHIFDKFYRVKNDASHSIKGTGLGLYLVKYFVELHGGEIDVESELGQGTKFQIKLKNG